MKLKISAKERRRLQAMSRFENDLYAKGYCRICGVDEAGRGPLAGPVVAAACILPCGYLLEALNDSKQVSERKREELYLHFVNDPQVIFGISIVDHQVIDKINILRATLQAMQEAVFNLKEKPDFLLIDGNQLPTIDIPKQGIVDGDALSISIAAASIIAKVTRDNIMKKYDVLWPQYNFKENKGYPTPAHKEALKEFGPCEIHRVSFSPLLK